MDPALLREARYYWMLSSIDPIGRFIMEIDILGIDLAKHIFQLHGAERSGRALYRSKVGRGGLIETVHRLRPRIVAMEACSSAHH